MAIIDLFKIIELKKNIEKEFGIKLHIHDGCSMQFFSFDKKVSDELVEYIKKSLETDKLKVVFSPDGLNLHMEDK